MRIEVCLESKKFKFLNLKVRNEKKMGVTFWKKCIFAKISLFQGYFSRFLFRGPKHLSWVTLCHARKKNRSIDKKVSKFFYALLWWLPLINHWVLSPYLGTCRTRLTRAFQNTKTISKNTPLFSKKCGMGPTPPCG